MSRSATQTAILVFLRSEQEEARAKRFLPVGGRRRNRQIAALLNRHVLRLARTTGYSVEVIKGDQQVGGTFGERFTNAIAAVFSLGYSKVIAIGNDCLALKPQRLQTAQGALADHPMVLGPAYDGGAYLIGLNRAAFDASAFLHLPWQQPSLFDALLGYGRCFGDSVSLLPHEWDADDTVSFARARTSLAEDDPFGKRLASCLTGNSVIAPLRLFLKPFHYRSAGFLRGPPLILSI